MKKLIVILIIVLAGIFLLNAVSETLIAGDQTIPKYQIHTVRVDDDDDDFYDRVLLIKLNTITGETDIWYEQYSLSKKLKFTF